MKEQKIINSQSPLDQFISEKNKGIYILEFYAESSFELNIKKFAGRVFPKGYYYYSGSAQKNLSSRLSRHLRIEKIIHWHIDHLTTHPDLNIKAVYICDNGPKSLECEIVANLIGLKNIEQPLLGFGNGDCSTCKTHLIYSKTRIPQSHLFSLYQDMVRFIPSSRETF